MSLINFKNNIRTILRETGLSQNDLAQKAGLSSGCISRFLTYSKRNSVSAETVEKLSNALNIQMDDLYKNEIQVTRLAGSGEDDVSDNSHRDRPVV